MMTLRKAQDRGAANYGWLDTRYSFSFADYHDPAHMGFRDLRVINEDWIAAGKGFGKHPHREMEIITYLLEGALAHEDSAGHRGVIRPGEVQRMSAGTGIFHSEFNHSNQDAAHLLQIWIQPGQRGVTPSWEQKDFREALDAGGLVLIASPDGRDGSVTINQDCALYAARLKAAETAELPLVPGRHAWVQVARGQLNLNGQDLQAGDGAALSEETTLQLRADTHSEFLLFDLP